MGTTTTTTSISSTVDDNILKTDYHRNKYINILVDDIRNNDDHRRRRHLHHCDDRRSKRCVSNNIVLWKNSIDTSFSLGSKNVFISRSRRRFEREKVVRNNILISFIFVLYTIMHYLFSPNGYVLRNTRYDHDNGINNQSMGFDGIIHCTCILSSFVIMQTYLSSSSSSCFTTTTTTTSTSPSSSSSWSHNCHRRK